VELLGTSSVELLGTVGSIEGVSGSSGLLSGTVSDTFKDWGAFVESMSVSAIYLECFLAFNLLVKSVGCFKGSEALGLPVLTLLTDVVGTGIVFSISWTVIGFGVSEMCSES